MSIIVIGLNHRTADVDVREQIAFNKEDVEVGLKGILSLTNVQEAIILSTCNRVEIYLDSAGKTDVSDDVKDFLAHFHTIERDKLDSSLYVYLDDDGVRHIFRVASSLDSMVLGEPQILGQLKDAFELALSSRASGIILNKLMKKAISVAKRVRTETRIAENAVSIGYAAVELARKIFKDLDDKVFRLLGAGEMAELAARHLTNSGVKEVIVANRTYSRGCALAEDFSGRAIHFDDFKTELANADIVICSTGAPAYVLNHDDMDRIMKGRRHRSVFIIDISVPRNIDPAINSLDNVYLYDIDDLQGVVDSNMNERKSEALRADSIIDDEVATFYRWLGSLDTVPTIVALREMAESIKRDELTKLFNKIGDVGEKQRNAIEQMAGTLVNKLIHPPTAALRCDHEDKDTLVATVKKLYGLNGGEDVGD